MNLNLPIVRVESMVRRAAKVRNHAVEVIIVEDSHEPVVVGESGGWYTMGGTPIRHPSAYSAKGWSNMQYCCEERTIYVGNKWIERRIGSLLN